MCATDLISGRRLRLWGPELKICPFDTGPDTLFVAYYASAEIGCFLALGWPVPARILDLFVEFRALINGWQPAAGYGLLGAMTHYGLAHMAPAEKQALRERILAGPPWSRDDRDAILDYCAEDVEALAALLPVMEPEIASSPLRFGQALLRGRYMAAAAAMERVGVPVDVGLLAQLRTHWKRLHRALIEAVDGAYGVYEHGHFRTALFEAMTAQRGYVWPRLPSGAPALDAETFRTMAGLHPVLEPLRQLRNTLGELRLHDLAVGPDGRNRVLLSAFRAKTGRNAPSSSKFIFGPATWVRFLIKPDPGTALAYIDWKAQEIGIAAALSGDDRLAAAVLSGDPYLAFAIGAQLAPPDATKATHGALRDRIKASVLGIGYGMSDATLARRLGVSNTEARMLLRLHDEAYPAFARWRENNFNAVLLGQTPQTMFGWQLHTTTNTKPNTLKNFPIQATGAEMLRLACCLATECGVRICAPVHDAILIEAAEDAIEAAVATARLCMAEASRVVLGGLEIGTDVKIVRPPHRYEDARGRDLFDRITGLLAGMTVETEVARKPPEEFNHLAKQLSV
jgi:hypothetical protein